MIKEPEQPERGKLGRTVALTAVVFAISLAVLSMTLLALSVLPQIFPTLAPSTGTFTPSSIRMAEAKSTALSRSDLESVIQTARDAWVSGDADAFAELFTADGEFVIPGQIYRGTAAIRSVIADFSDTHTNVQIDIQRTIIDGNQAVVEWHWRDTDTSGKQTMAEDAIVVDFIGTQISRWREYIDEATPRNA